jgi:hypothetical protein
VGDSVLVSVKFTDKGTGPSVTFAVKLATGFTVSASAVDAVTIMKTQARSINESFLLGIIMSPCLI